ncbi:MAG: AAA family ATPase [Deltaproteobacteria bacterium]|nr:AAA family ATPase [Deltaproteobacteria bacterium]
MKTFAIVNQKGGCGKTTTSINLAAGLADRGKKVLLVDMDPQSHASLGLNITVGELDLGLYDVLLAVGEEDGPRLDDIVAPVVKNLDLVPSNIILSAFEQKMAGTAGRETRLLEAINAMEGEYDYLLIDCPPSVGLLSFNALMAVHHVIIPIEPSFFSLHGLGKQIESIRIFTEKLNHFIEIHTLVTMFDRRTRLSREVLEEVQKHFGKQLFQTVIHNNIRLKEAAGYGSPICKFDRHCTGFHDFQALAEEVSLLKAVEVQVQPVETLGPRPVRNGILFSLDAPNVKSLKLVGDFNNWTPDKNSELEKGEAGRWEKTLSLPPGRYHYKFIADGEWREDSGNPNYIINDFGGIDSVVEVKPIEFPELMQQDRSLGMEADQQEAS